MNNKLIDYIKNSFLSPLLNNDDVTDISFNGQFIFYVSNSFGRKKSNIYITEKEANDFIRQIANLSEKQFCYSFPILDILAGKYRINAVHGAIAKVYEDRSLTFSIRISSKTNRIDADTNFIEEKCINIIKAILSKKESIIIAGTTGSGKTELQKYILNMLDTNQRVIVIDNVQELDSLRQRSDLDIVSWQVNEKIMGASFEELIRNALRSNPDWIVIAESRGKEMSDVLMSAMTGHPVISTLHAKSIYSIPERMLRMVQYADKTSDPRDILSDIANSIPFYFFLEKTIDEQGKVVRFISKIGKLDQSSNKMILIYERTKNEK